PRSPCARSIIRASFAATGRGWRHPSFTCKRPAPGRTARWPEIQEARCDRFRRSGSNVAEPETAEEAHGLPRLRRLTFNGPRHYGGPQLAAALKRRRRRGCREATRGAGDRPLYRLPVRHPRTRRTLAGISPAGLVAFATVQASIWVHSRWKALWRTD